MDLNNTSSLDPLLDWILQDNQAITPIQLPTNENSSTEASSSTITKTRKSSPSEEDDEEEELTDAQLKLLPSKERRALRNKISARKFRNRRKEYLNTLETRLENCQTENARLQIEVKWMHDMMDKLQSENDRLRVELALCKSGIQTNPSQQPRTIHTDWDYLCPPPPSNDVYLSHATVPVWNLPDILSTEKTTHLMQTYPLLAPTLMSIVLQHTMSMTTDELLAHAKLAPYTSLSLPSKYPSTLTKSIDFTESLKQNYMPQPKRSMCPLNWLKNTLY
ncbi:uncharacterized protein B0P05DRAFT_572229 [Gilbertella persicaria]|uniref:uncharacterized protein n=1 Tax=Gilbertella persicaria TaxID=101096 RepID=UPI00221FD903|nr:uncharacterized protein B0P05DRAFT_572229 [Gilbertella persicaria]KAI8076556.1 hypothetical protein B0P05DRAFT_572229 [Gilbertella persicaria]